MGKRTTNKRTLNVKFTIIGLGSIGTRHAANLRLMGHTVQGFDTGMYVEEASDSDLLKQLIDWADAVLVCTPPSSHADYMMMAIKAQKDVFVEKPMFSAEEYRPMIGPTLNAADDGACITVGFNLRFHHCVKTAKAIIDSGRLGAIWNAEFSVLQKTEKDAYRREHIFTNWAIHEIDLAQHLLGPMKGVDWAKTDAEATCGTLMVTHHNMCKTTIKADYTTDPEVRKFDISGEKGRIECDLVKRTLIFTPTNGEPQVHQMADSFDQNYKDEMAALVQALQEKEEVQPLAYHLDGLSSLHIAVLAIELAGTTK